MPRRLGLFFLASIGAATVAGCGVTGDASITGHVDRIHRWNADVLYFPPPAPVARVVHKVSAAGGHSTPPAASKPAEDEATADATSAPGAPTDAEVAAELKQAFKGSGSHGSIVDQATLTTADLATVPPTAPEKVADMINAGNQVARFPYVYGGGHGGGGGPEGTFTDTAYDCSGSVSYALAAAGYLKSPADSTSLEHFGKPGKGKWVSIYANADHAFMYVAGLRFDTVGRATHGSRWQTAGRSVSGFTVRHPPGL